MANSVEDNKKPVMKEPAKATFVLDPRTGTRVDSKTGRPVSTQPGQRWSGH